MSGWQRMAAVAALAGLTMVGACLTPGEPEAIRYYRVAPPPAGAGQARGTTLRLLNVRAAEHLQLPMVWRRNEVEMGVYDLHRWVEEPQHFVQQHLEAALFHEAKLRRSTVGTVPTLEVALQELAEVDTDKAPEAYLRLQVLLTDDRSRAIWETTIERSKPLAEDTRAAFAVATGEMLRTVAQQLAAEVSKRLAQLP